MRSISPVLLAVFALLAAPEASAAEATALYARGHFEEAIAAGEAEGGSQGLATAARAVLAEAELREVPCLSCVERAEELARAAIAADAENAEPYVYLVVALGRRARLIGFFQAQRERIGSQTDNAIETALMLDPNFSWALATRGGWHIEVVRLAGRILGRIFFGARVEDGKGFFDRAMAMEPGNLVIPYQYALTLAAYDLDGERSAIRNALMDSIAIAPRDTYETAIKMRAETLLEQLDAGADGEFLRLLDIYRGNP